MKNIAKINSDLIAAGVPVTGVSALHETGTRAMIVCGGSQAYRIDFAQEPTEEQYAAAIAATIEAMPDGINIYTIKTRNSSERQAEEKTEADERTGAIRAQEAADAKALAAAAAKQQGKRR